MPLFRKPHTLTLIEASENIGGDGVVETTDHEATAVTVRGQVTPEAAATVFERFDVVVSKPHLFLFDLPDFDLVKIGNRWTLDGRTFVTRVEPQKWNAETRTSCGAAILEEL